MDWGVDGTIRIKTSHSEVRADVRTSLVFQNDWPESMGSVSRLIECHAFASMHIFERMSCHDRANAALRACLDGAGREARATTRRCVAPVYMLAAQRARTSCSIATSALPCSTSSFNDVSRSPCSCAHKDASTSGVQKRSCASLGPNSTDLGEHALRWTVITPTGIYSSTIHGVSAETGTSTMRPHHIDGRALMIDGGPCSMT